MPAATSNPAARSAAGSTSLSPTILASTNSHVDLVGVFFLLWGLLTILIGASTLALGVAAAALIDSAAQAGGSFAAGVTAAAFTTLALMAVLWGAAHVVVGMSIRRLRHWSRLAALSLGAVDLLLLPYGTAVGAYALWVLLRDEGKRLFT